MNKIASYIFIVIFTLLTWGMVYIFFNLTHNYWLLWLLIIPFFLIKD